MLSRPYTASCFHSCFSGKRFFNTACEIKSIMMLAIKKRVTAITKGWADSKPILVAAEAEDHKMAKQMPAISSLKLF